MRSKDLQKTLVLALALPLTHWMTWWSILPLCLCFFVWKIDTEFLPYKVIKWNRPQIWKFCALWNTLYKCQVSLLSQRPPEFDCISPNGKERFIPGKGSFVDVGTDQASLGREELVCGKNMEGGMVRIQTRILPLPQTCWWPLGAYRNFLLMDFRLFFSQKGGDMGGTVQSSLLMCLFYSIFVVP